MSTRSPPKAGKASSGAGRTAKTSASTKSASGKGKVGVAKKKGGAVGPATAAAIAANVDEVLAEAVGYVSAKAGDVTDENVDRNSSDEFEAVKSPPKMIVKKPVPISMRLVAKRLLAPEFVATATPEQVANGLSGQSRIRLDGENIAELDGLEFFADSCTHLYVQRNIIERIEGLEFLSKLTLLTLARNRIRVIEGIKGLSSLRAFDVTYNQIESIDAQQLPNGLLYLNVSHNPVDVENREDVLATLWEGAPSLRQIDDVYRPDDDEEEDDEEGEEEEPEADASAGDDGAEQAQDQRPASFVAALGNLTAVFDSTRNRLHERRSTALQRVRDIAGQKDGRPEVSSAAQRASDAALQASVAAGLDYLLGPDSQISEGDEAEDDMGHTIGAGAVDNSGTSAKGAKGLDLEECPPAIADAMRRKEAAIRSLRVSLESLDELKRRHVNDTSQVRRKDAADNDVNDSAALAGAGGVDDDDV